MIKKNILSTIGQTPIIYLEKLKKYFNLSNDILVKLEYFNPGGSIKDRIALAMINDALDKKLISKKTIIIEPTSGNTGIGLAMVCAYYDLQLVIVMPDTMSLERQNIIKAYGCRLILSDGSLGMQGAISKAKELSKEIPDSFIVSQFDNHANPNIHYYTTGPEIYEDIKGENILLFGGIGTGGSISGITKYLKEKNPQIKSIGIEPLGSPTINHGIKGYHTIEGIGAGFIPKNLDLSLIDNVLTVSDDEAKAMCRLIARLEGILLGISSGAVLAACVNYSQINQINKPAVCILADNGLKYLSTNLFN